MKMRKERFALWFLGSIMALFIMSCGGSPESEEENDETPVMEVTEEDDPADNEFLYALPSHLQIASIFRRSGLEYIPNLTNDPNNADNYNTKFMQKLNFGVYATDLAYCALNEKNQASIDYMTVLGKLSENLWMTNVFKSVSILNRFENNMGNSDSLGYIIADFQMEMDDYLEANGLSANSLVIFAGAWIESMHLAFNSVHANHNPQLVSRLIEQKKIAGNLIEILGAEDEDAELDILLGHLKKISSHFDSYDIENIDNEEDLYNLSMTEEQVSAALADVEAARTFIING